MRRHTALAASLVAAALASTAAFGASSEEFESAFAAATARAKQAVARKNQWPATNSALAEAKKAADAQDYDKAVTLAKQADALAAASVHQAESEAKAWKDAEIR